MRLIFAVLILSLGLNSLAQDRAKALSYVDTLCSPYFFGRGYSKDGVNKAADFLKKELEKREAIALFGASYFQPFQHDANIFSGTHEFTIADLSQELGVDYIQRGSSGSFRGKLPAVNIVLPSGMDRDFVRNIYHKHPAGSVVLVVAKSNLQDSEKGELLLTMLANSYPIVITGFDKLTWSVAGRNTHFPVLESLKEQIEEHSMLQIKITQEQKIFTSKNVGGYIPAANPSESFVFITAHYDHLGGLDGNIYIPGANDNASGTAMLLDMMDGFKVNPHPNYNIAFLFFAGEEIGLLGSKYYTDNPSVGLDRIKFVLNLDLMGSGDKGFAVVNAKLFPKYLAQLKAANDKLKKPLSPIKERGEAANSDHYWFSKNGVPAFFIYTMGGPSAYHDIYDDVDILPYSRYNEVYRMLSNFVRDLK